MSSVRKLCGSSNAGEWELTAGTIHLETKLDDHVYALFDLTDDEIALIEEVTKYEYGEV